MAQQLLFIKRFFLSAVLLFSNAVLFFCIQRDNPWDPINGCPKPYKNEVIAENEPLIKASLHMLDSIESQFTLRTTELDTTGLKNQIITRENDSISRQMEKVLNNNRIIDSINNINKCGPLILKDSLSGTLSSKDFLRGLDVLRRCRDDAAVEKMKISTYFTDADKACYPQGVFSSEYEDSVLNNVNGRIEKWDTLINQVQRFNDTVQEYNQKKIAVYNQKIKEENDNIKKYNVPLSRSLWHCGNVISSPESISVAISKLVPGDTLFLDSLTIEHKFKFNDLGFESGWPIVIMGSPNMNTVINPTEKFAAVSNCVNIHFINIVFSRGGQDGMRVEGLSRKIKFYNCIFKENNDHGLVVSSSSVELYNCKVHHNSKNGIYVVDANIFADNLLLTHNKNYGFYSTYSFIQWDHTTISDNQNGGFILESAAMSVELKNSLITFNGGMGISRESYERGEVAIFSIENVNLFGNTNDNIYAEDYFIRKNPPPYHYEPCYKNRDDNNYQMSDTCLLYNMNLGYSE